MFKYIILVQVIFFLSGCKTVDMLARNYLPEEVFIQTSDDSVPYISNNNEIDLSKILSAEVNGSENQAYRNDVISKIIENSDKKFTLHKATILSNASTWNVGAGGMALLFTSAAAVVSSSHAASNLAAAGAATLGIQSLVNEEVYADAMATTILRAIDILRVKKLAPIEQGLADPEYRFSQAVIDLQSYHHSCSMMAGLVEVTKALDNRKPSRSELERDIAKLKKSISTSDSTFKGVSEQVKISIVDEYAKKLSEKTAELINRKE